MISTPNMVTEIESRIRASGAGAVGLALCDPFSGRRLLVNAEQSFHPASTFKLCVMMEVYRQAALGRFSLDDPLTVVNKFSSIADGSPYSLSAGDDSETALYGLLGTQLPVRDLLARMITVSSNLATNILLELVQPADVTAFMHSLGAQGLLVRRGVEDNRAFALGLNNAATALALMQVLEKLARREVVSPEASDEMIAVLKAQRHNNGIPAGLPTGMPVAHKTGWNGLIYHDAAIVYPLDEAPYVLVVMTSGLADDSAAPQLVSSLSQLIFESRSAWR